MTIYRADIMKVTGLSRAVLRELELRGIIPPPEKDEKGWNIYCREHIQAMVKWYEKGNRKPPEGLIELLEQLREGVSMDEAK